MVDPAALWRALGTVPGFMEGASIFSEDDADRAYFVNGKQVAHGAGEEIQLRLTRAVIRERRPRLRAEPRVELRTGSDWVRVRVVAKPDVELVLELAELAAAAHRPAPGTIADPPPSGAALARRRRFH